jgi:hypothetical protein
MAFLHGLSFSTAIAPAVIEHILRRNRCIKQISSFFNFYLKHNLTCAVSGKGFSIKAADKIFHSNRRSVPIFYCGLPLRQFKNAFMQTCKEALLFPFFNAG